jgi:hypothetical protein
LAAAGAEADAETAPLARFGGCAEAKAGRRLQIFSGFIAHVGTVVIGGTRLQIFNQELRDEIIFRGGSDGGGHPRVFQVGRQAIAHGDRKSTAGAHQ